MKDLFVDALSRGMQQRVALARTMMHDPEVLILDEPANGLDPQAGIDMRTMLLLSDLGKTLIVTSHILPELARICDVVAMITKGKLRAAGTVDTIMREIQQKRTFEIMLLQERRSSLFADKFRLGWQNKQTRNRERVPAARGKACRGRTDGPVFHRPNGSTARTSARRTCPIGRDHPTIPGGIYRSRGCVPLRCE